MILALNTARIFLLASVIALPLSTAALNVFVALCIVSWAISGTVRRTLSDALTNPLAKACLGLFALLCLGTLYPGVAWQASLEGLNHYRKLLFVPIFIALFSTEKLRQRGLLVFALAMALTLVLSYVHAIYPFEWAVHSRRGEHDNHAIFKHHLIQNIMMTCAMVIWIGWGSRRNGFMQWWFWLGVLVIAINVWTMVDGRTGQIALAVVLLWSVWHYAPASIRLRLLGAGSALAIAIAIALSFSPSRLSKIPSEIRAFHSGTIESSSSGQRLEFWKQSLAAIKERPIVGWGTGSYSSQYCKRGASEFSCKHGAYNPHNQYIFLAVQLGVIGLGAYLAFLIYLFAKASQLPREQKALATSLVIMLAIHSMFDSPLFVVTEGHFYLLLLSLAFGSWGQDRHNQELRT